MAAGLASELPARPCLFRHSHWSWRTWGRVAFGWGLVAGETYFEDKLKFDISRVVLATGVECDIMYPFYDDEMFIPKNSVETQILRSYIVDPSGHRVALQRQF